MKIVEIKSIINGWIEAEKRIIPDEHDFGEAMEYQEFRMEVYAELLKLCDEKPDAVEIAVAKQASDMSDDFAPIKGLCKILRDLTGDNWHCMRSMRY